MAFTAENNNPYFWLNFTNQSLDAEIYQQLEIEIYSSASTELQLVFANDTSGISTLFTNVIYSDLSPIDEGWQSLTINLEDLTWRSVNAQQQTTRWGGEVDLVYGIRIHPSKVEGASIIIKSVKLTSNQSLEAAPLNLPTTLDTTLPTTLSTIVPIGISQDQSMLEIGSMLSQVTSPIQVFYDQSTLRTVESSLQFRDQIEAAFPNAILFPNDSLQENYLAMLQTPKDRLNFQPPVVMVVLQVLSLGLILLSVSSLLFSKSNLMRSVYNKRYLPSIILILFLSTLWGLSSTGFAQWLIIYLGVAFMVFLYFLLASRITEQPKRWLQILGLVNAPKISWMISGFITILLLIVILSLAIFFNTFDQIDSKIFLENLWLYPLWGLVQQILIGPVLGFEILRACQHNMSISNSGTQSQQSNIKDRNLWQAALLTGLVFALLHTPNFSLMAVTFPLGSLWCFLYLKYKSIIPLAISHGIMATLFRELAPAMLRMDGDVGLSYYHWLWI